MEANFSSFREFHRQLGDDRQGGNFVQALRRLCRDQVIHHLDDPEDPEDPDSQRGWNPWVP